MHEPTVEQAPGMGGAQTPANPFDPVSSTDRQNTLLPPEEQRIQNLINNSDYKQKLQASQTQFEKACQSAFSNFAARHQNPLAPTSFNVRPTLLQAIQTSYNTQLNTLKSLSESEQKSTKEALDKLKAAQTEAVNLYLASLAYGPILRQLEKDTPTPNPAQFGQPLIWIAAALQNRSNRKSLDSKINAQTERSCKESANKAREIVSLVNQVRLVTRRMHPRDPDDKTIETAIKDGSSRKSDVRALIYSLAIESPEPVKFHRGNMPQFEVAQAVSIESILDHNFIQVSHESFGKGSKVYQEIVSILEKKDLSTTSKTPQELYKALLKHSAEKFGVDATIKTFFPTEYTELEYRTALTFKPFFMENVPGQTTRNLVGRGNTVLSKLVQLGFDKKESEGIVSDLAKRRAQEKTDPPKPTKIFEASESLRLENSSPSLTH